MRPNRAVIKGFEKFDVQIYQMPAPEYSVLPFDSAADWEAWLREHGSKVPGVWIRLAKKGSQLTSVSYAEAVEVALCYGWIDGQVKGLDERCYLQKFTPRKARSIWSQINRAKAEDLIERGRMQPAGLQAVESARQDGRWEQAYASPSKMEVPEDLQKALDLEPKAAESFATLTKQNRYAILFRIETARKPETRLRRISKILEMLRAGETFH